MSPIILIAHNQSDLVYSSVADWIRRLALDPEVRGSILVRVSSIFTSFWYTHYFVISFTQYFCILFISLLILVFLFNLIYSIYLLPHYFSIIFISLLIIFFLNFIADRPIIYFILFISFIYLLTYFIVFFF